MKQAGKCRFVGISGHNLPARFIPFLEHGDVDVILVAMKVFGAPDPKTGSWGTRKALPRVGIESVELAIRYALGVPGVATANLGVHTTEQLRHNVDCVARYRPLSTTENDNLLGRGKEMAALWGPHLGPVS